MPRDKFYFGWDYPRMVERPCSEQYVNGEIFDIPEASAYTQAITTYEQKHDSFYVYDLVVCRSEFWWRSDQYNLLLPGGG